MPDTNCLLTHTSPEHAVQMILQVRHLNSRYVVVLQYFLKNTVVRYLSIPPTPAGDVKYIFKYSLIKVAKGMKIQVIVFVVSQQQP